MGIAASLFLAAAVGAPLVELSTLTGDQQSGQLTRLNATTVTLKTGETELNVPLAEVIDLRFAQQPKAIDSSKFQVVLVDGSRFGFTKVEATVRDVSLETIRLGHFKVPLSSVASLRFAPSTADVKDAWNELQTRKLKRDLLVIRKGAVLDHLDGVVGTIDEQSIKFLLDGDEIPIPRRRVFGVIYARRETDGPKPTCRALLHGSDILHLMDISWDGDQLRAKLLAGTQVVLPIEQLDTLDFSLGKIRYLSQMEPREVKYTPYFDITYKYRRDRNLDGGPLQLGNKKYARGLCIHSRTYLRYRLATEYRRFQTIIGIDQELVRRRVGDVHVVISGDGMPLLEADVRWMDKPRTIDLDVSGVRDLEIFVDFGGDLAIGDHLDLADAKVIK